MGHVRSVYIPPLRGGLFLDQGALDTITGGPFLIDHDQKLAGQGALIYDVGDSGIWAGTNVRYDWTAAVTRPWMRLLAPAARPLFAWNHNTVVAWGHEGLTHKLA